MVHMYGTLYVCKVFHTYMLLTYLYTLHMLRTKHFRNAVLHIYVTYVCTYVTYLFNILVL